MKKLKQLRQYLSKLRYQSKCKHVWTKGRVIREYYDYSGNHVFVVQLRCRKCKKTDVKKYFRHGGELL